MMKNVTLTSVLLALTATLALASDSVAPLRIQFLPLSCDLRTHSLIEGFVIVENRGDSAIRLPADLELGNGYAGCVIRRQNGHEEWCMGEIQTSWPTADDSVVSIPPRGAYARRTAFLAINHVETLELGVVLHLPPDKVTNTPRQTIRSEWTKVTLRPRE